MQKCLFHVFIGIFLAFLAACQSTQGTSSLFNPFGSSSTSGTSLTQRVQEALVSHEDLALAKIHVQTQYDVVILTGYVKKIRQSDVAEQVARQVPGVRSVENHIIVRP
jgi:osmotically-inducible protein OsmY